MKCSEHWWKETKEELLIYETIDKLFTCACSAAGPCAQRDGRGNGSRRSGGRGGDCYFVYNNVLLLVLNTNNLSTAEHRAFVEQAIKATADQNITWKIVTFHQSIYTVASHYHNDCTQRREELVPVFKKMAVAFVVYIIPHIAEWLIIRIAVIHYGLRDFIKS